MAGLSFVYFCTGLQRNKSSLCRNVLAGSVLACLPVHTANEL